jgi:hypothetical protein
MLVAFSSFLSLSTISLLPCHFLVSIVTASSWPQLLPVLTHSVASSRPHRAGSCFAVTQCMLQASRVLDRACDIIACGRQAADVMKTVIATDKCRKMGAHSIKRSGPLL